MAWADKSTYSPRTPKAKAPSGSDRHPTPLCVLAEPLRFCGGPQQSQILASRGKAGPRYIFSVQKVGGVCTEVRCRSGSTLTKYKNMSANPLPGADPWGTPEWCIYNSICVVHVASHGTWATCMIRQATPIAGTPLLCGQR